MEADRRDPSSRMPDTEGGLAHAQYRQHVPGSLGCTQCKTICIDCAKCVTDWQ